MPEFVLKEFRNPVGRPPKRVVFTKNEYCKKVRMYGWDIERQGEPKDYNAYRPPGGNQFMSSYKRLGSDKEQSFVSTTRIMQNQICGMFSPGLDRLPMANYFITKFEPEEENCPLVVESPYVSTMRESYGLPYPYDMPPVPMEVTPFLQNRKLRQQDPYVNENKFFDDDTMDRVRLLQKHKACRTVSYNPMTDKYSDTSPLDKDPRECVPVPIPRDD